MNKPQEISIDPHSRLYTLKYQNIKLSDVKAVNIYSKKKGIMIFEPIDSVNLWWEVGKVKNIAIFFTSWIESYDPAIDIPAYRAIILSSLNQKINFSQVPINFHVQSLLIPKVETYGLLTRKDLPLILNFINYRYKQNLSYVDFMNGKKEVVEQKMINYILDKESEKEHEITDKTSN